MGGRRALQLENRQPKGDPDGAEPGDRTLAATVMVDRKEEGGDRLMLLQAFEISASKWLSRLSQFRSQFRCPLLLHFLPPV
jgi:hypothetical protein